MSAPKADHWISAKRVLCYVQGTPEYGLLYTQSSDPTLSGYTDSDWVGSVDDRKYTAGYVFSLGFGVVTWNSKKQQAIALSSTEAEHQGAVKASCEAVWLRCMLADMHVFQAGPTPLFYDNQAVLKLAKNLVFHERTKHVETHCHYIGELVEDGCIQLLYVPIMEQPTNIFTKPLGPDKFVKFKGSIGVVNRLSIKGGFIIMLSLMLIYVFYSDKIVCDLISSFLIETCYCYVFSRNLLFLHLYYLSEIHCSFNYSFFEIHMRVFTLFYS